jgi:hypothetical protein
MCVSCEIQLISMNFLHNFCEISVFQNRSPCFSALLQQYFFSNGTVFFSHDKSTSTSAAAKLQRNEQGSSTQGHIQEFDIVYLLN